MNTYFIVGFLLKGRLETGKDTDSGDQRLGDSLKKMNLHICDRHFGHMSWRGETQAVGSAPLCQQESSWTQSFIKLWKLHKRKMSSFGYIILGDKIPGKRFALDTQTLVVGRGS